MTYQSLKNPLDCKSKRLPIQPPVEYIFAQWSELKDHFKLHDQLRNNMLLNGYIRCIHMEKNRNITVFQPMLGDEHKISKMF